MFKGSEVEIRIITCNNDCALRRKIQDFIEDKEVIDIKYGVAPAGHYTWEYSVMIIYKKQQN